MILLKSLQLKNFLSHTDSTIVLTAESRLLLDGKSGAGKSSFVEALVWALYNQGRVQNRSLIKRGKKNMSVRVDLENIDGYGELAQIHDYYTIERSLTLPKANATPTHEIKIWKNSEPVQVSGTRNVQDYIEKRILHCSYELFTNSVCYLQENLGSFARQTPSVRKDILLELVHADDYDTFYEKARQTISGLDTKIITNTARKEALWAEMTRNHPLLEALPRYEEDLKAVNIQVEAVEAQLRDIQGQETELALTKVKIESLNTQKRDLVENILKIQRLQKDSQKLITELQAINPKEIKVKFEEAQTLQKKLIDLETQLEQRRRWQSLYTQLISQQPVVKDYSVLIDQTKKELEEITQTKVVDEKCPNCGTAFPCFQLKEKQDRRLMFLTDNLADYTKNQANGNEKLTAHLLTVSELKEKEVVVDETQMSVLKFQLSKLEPYIEKFYSAQNREALLTQHQQLVTQYDKTLEQYTGDLDRMRTTILEREGELKIYSNLKEQKTIFLKQQQELQIHYGQLSESVALGRAAASRKETIDKELVQYSTEDKEWKTRMENLQLLKEALGQNGVRTIVLDYAIPQLETRINNVLSKLSNFTIRLDTQKSNVTGESQIEGLFISILNENGEEFDYDSYSGGQKIKILFAISEGLAEMQKIGFRILDEAVIGLDTETGQQFAEAILAFQSNYSQLLCISHVREIKDLFEKIVNIININGDSKIYEKLTT